MDGLKPWPFIAETVQIWPTDAEKLRPNSLSWRLYSLIRSLGVTVRPSVAFVHSEAPAHAHTRAHTHTQPRKRLRHSVLAWPQCQTHVNFVSTHLNAQEYILMMSERISRSDLPAGYMHICEQQPLYLGCCQAGVMRCMNWYYGNCSQQVDYASWSVINYWT